MNDEISQKIKNKEFPLNSNPWTHCICRRLVNKKLYLYNNQIALQFIDKKPSEDLYSILLS